MSIRNIVIFDIDGTLADVRHRVHHVSSSEKSERDWISFNAEMVNDTPIVDMCILADEFHVLGYGIWMLTGRQEKFRAYTNQWLFWNRISYDDLRMRPSKDQRKDFECKSDMLLPEEEKRIFLIIEDRQTVVDMWRKRGLTVLQCDNGESNEK